MNFEVFISNNFRSGESAGLTAQIHPVFPEMPHGQSELFFECTLFLYSVLALFLQYLNIYKTMWWLPKSYWHYSIVSKVVLLQTIIVNLFYRSFGFVFHVRLFELNFWL